MPRREIYTKARANRRLACQQAEKAVQAFRQQLRRIGYVLHKRCAQDEYTVTLLDDTDNVIAGPMTLEELRAYMRDLRTK